MGEILGVGLTHYPPLCWPDENMADLLRMLVGAPGVPAEGKDRTRWPKAMLDELGDDEGVSAGRRHREQLVAGFRATRRAIDEFAPDFVVIFGDDQYENFREDLIPPFCIFGLDEIALEPWAEGFGAMRPNRWGEPKDFVFAARGHREGARAIARGLLATRGGFAQLLSAEPKPEIVDPPAPSPRRCMEVGAKLAEVIEASPYRVALVASSSWSHAFLSARNSYLWPDLAADRRLYEALRQGNYAAWREQPLEEYEAAGQHELLNWCVLLGAMERLGRKPEIHDWIETYVFNSNKCFATFPVNGGAR